MSEEALVVPSFLDEDLSQVDTSMPVLAEASAVLKIDDSSLVLNKDKTGQLWKLKMVTTAQMRSTTGEMLSEGFPVFAQVSLKPTEKYSEESIKKAVASWLQAAGVPRLNHEELKGKLVQCKIAARGERTDEKTGQVYPPSNELRPIVPKK